MASLKIDIPHELSQAEALLRIRKLLSKVQQEQKEYISNVKEEWEGQKGNFEFNAKGFDLSGTIDVQPGNIYIDASVPFAVSLFKSKIKEIINEKAKELLAR